jgi:hypothetical protein
MGGAATIAARPALGLVAVAESEFYTLLGASMAGAAGGLNLLR